MIEVVVTTGLLELQVVQSSSQIITTNKPTSSFYRPDALPVAQPTVSVKALKGKYHIPWTCLPQAHLGVFQLCLSPLIVPGYLGGGLPCLSSALWCQYPSTTQLYILVTILLITQTLSVKELRARTAEPIKTSCQLTRRMEPSSEPSHDSDRRQRHQLQIWMKFLPVEHRQMFTTCTLPT